MPAIIRNGHIYGASPMFPIGAGDIDYNNTSSELESTNIQDAVDELKGIIDANPGTTYTLDTNGNNITLTPSDGQVQSITAPYATSAGDASTVNSHTVAADVPSNAVFTDTTYENATTSAAGLMSSDDKTKLNGVAIGAEVNVQADWNEASSSSDAYILNKPTLGTAAAANTTDFDAAGTAASAIAALDSSTDDNTVTDTTDTSLNLLTSVTIQNGLITAKKHTTFTIATQQEIANIFS